MYQDIALLFFRSHHKTIIYWKPYLVNINSKHIETYGYPMTYKKMILALEKYRNNDYQKFIEKDDYILHKLILVRR